MEVDITTRKVIITLKMDKEKPCIIKDRAQIFIFATTASRIPSMCSPKISGPKVSSSFWGYRSSLSSLSVLL